MKYIKYLEAHFHEKNDFTTLNSVIILYDQEDETIAEFEFFTNTCVSFDYSHTLEEYSVGHEISKLYNINSSEYTFEDFYDIINNIFDDYDCLVDISSNWFDFVNRFFPNFYDEEMSRYNKYLETNCTSIINEFEKEYRKEEKRQKFNI